MNVYQLVYFILHHADFRFFFFDILEEIILPESFFFPQKINNKKEKGSVQQKIGLCLSLLKLTGFELDPFRREKKSMQLIIIVLFFKMDLHVMVLLEFVFNLTLYYL